MPTGVSRHVKVTEYYDDSDDEDVPAKKRQRGKEVGLEGVQKKQQKVREEIEANHRVSVAATRNHIAAAAQLETGGPDSNSQLDGHMQLFIEERGFNTGGDFADQDGFDGGGGAQEQGEADVDEEYTDEEVDEIEDNRRKAHERLWGDTPVETTRRKRHHSYKPDARRLWMEKQAEEWAVLMPAVCDSYLLSRYGSDSMMAVDEDEGFEDLVVTQVDLNDITSHTVRVPHGIPRAVAIARDGALPGTTEKPTYTFTFKLLQHYRCLKQRTPANNIEGFTRSLRTLFMFGPDKQDALQDNFSRAFDQFVELEKTLDEEVAEILGRTGDWRFRLGCPACGNKQDGEPVLNPSSIHAMDGGNSYKRLDKSGRNDRRVFHSEFFLSCEHVDGFSDQVHQRASGPGAGSRQRRDGTHVSPDDGPIPCVDTWTTTNAQDLGNKRLGEVFDHTGLFALVCRHGIVEAAAEMRKSGELAKYPLAMLNVLLEKYEPCQACGYDIGCSMDGTCQRSKLGPAAAERKLMLLVNAFHGYQHNRLCQCDYHPLYREGIGMEDMETCERLFSVLNSVARCIRTASTYHWIQAIHLRIKQLNEDRYEALGRTVLNGFQDAIETIDSNMPELQKWETKTGFKASDALSWLAEERAWIINKKSEPEEDILKCEYVESLRALVTASEAFDRLISASDTFLNTTPADFVSASSRAASTAKQRAAVAERQSATLRVNNASKVVDACERRLGITERWTAATPEYVATSEYLSKREFTRAVGELQGLVMQRLFELSKANLADTGYKLRQTISSGITKRSEAIKKALDRYNAAAAKQTPRQPHLEYSEVTNWIWLGDFELLKAWDSELTDQPWTQPANREAAGRYWRVLRANEEITRCQVEAWRLWSWVEDEDSALEAKVDATRSTRPLLASYASDYARRRHLSNNRIRFYLRKLFDNPHYQGRKPEPAALARVSTEDPASNRAFDDAEDESLLRASDLLSGLSLSS